MSAGSLATASAKASSMLLSPGSTVYSLAAYMDPRDEIVTAKLRSDVTELSDLTPGMVLEGTVRNVVDFGVFVDIGVHQDGLVHISRICEKFIKHPSEAVRVGDIVKVKVLEVDAKRKRISLTMRDI